jgi:hypothetical protein
VAQRSRRFEAAARSRASRPAECPLARRPTLLSDAAPRARPGPLRSLGAARPRGRRCPGHEPLAPKRPAGYSLRSAASLPASEPLVRVWLARQFISGTEWRTARRCSSALRRPASYARTSTSPSSSRRSSALPGSRPRGSATRSSRWRPYTPVACKTTSRRASTRREWAAVASSSRACSSSRTARGSGPPRRCSKRGGRSLIRPGTRTQDYGMVAARQVSQGA